MTEIIAMQTYRTETLEVDGQTCVVRFHKRKDGQEYLLTATNEATGKTRNAYYSQETADDFARQNGEELEVSVFELLRNAVVG